MKNKIIFISLFIFLVAFAGAFLSVRQAVMQRPYIAVVNTSGDCTLNFDPFQDEWILYDENGLIFAGSEARAVGIMLDNCGN